MIELTKDEAYVIAALIDNVLFNEIRTDTEFNNLMWLRNIIHGYEKLCKISGYQGVTENEDE